MKNQNFDDTIKKYQKLGKQYLKNIEPYTPVEFSEFMKIIPKGGKVLDVGCAGGRDSIKFVQKGFDVTGIDLVDVFLKEAKKKIPDAKFIKMNVKNPKFPNNYFDAIWANAVLLHIKKKDIPKVLKDFYKILKPSGRLHIRVKEGRGTEYKDERLTNGKKRMFTYFLKDELEKFVKNASFKIIISRIFPDESERKDVKWISIWAKK